MGGKQLAGKTALVTGGSSGIGMASAQLLARDGAVVVVMARKAGELTAARDNLRAAAPDARIELFVGDAMDEDSVRAALAYAHGLAGRLDIIVPAIGGGDFGPLLMQDLATVRHEFALNFDSVFLAVRHGAPLLGKGGSIVCLSTAVAIQAYWGLSIYASAKAAVERFVRAAAFELGGAGIRINAVRPGMTASAATADMSEMAGLVDYFASQTALGRIGEPMDLARAVRFLAGPESGWVTGQIFSCDGGQDQGKAPDMMDDLYGKDVMDRMRAGQPTERPGAG